MLNKIKNAIAAKLSGEFGSGYKIYFDESEQGFEKPCFFIVPLNSSQKQFMGNRYLVTNVFAIYYYTSSLNKNDEMNDISIRLDNVLEYISVDDSLIRGANIKHERVNGVLNTLINYNMFLLKNKEIDSVMENIKTNVGI